ncbi:MAG: hypothetical protein HY826_08975 [Actinobacteria bacterium]|nr:hypothetical protein [Actinomycetota bacterium]
MKFRYLPVAGLAFGILVIGSASQAMADIPGTDGCAASGVWVEDGLIVVAETDNGVFTIPRSDTVNWEGSVAGPPGEYSGSVWVELPPPFGEVEVDSWSGDSETTSNSGSHEYDLPSLVPAGVEIVVSGEHNDENGSCSGKATLEIDGGPFDSPVTLISLGGTAVTGLGVALTLRPLFRRVL